MATKTDKSFITHMDNARKTVGYTGIITKMDIVLLKVKFKKMRVKEFDDYAIAYLKRKKEEN